MIRRFLPSLPLLTKELTERSARKRTYGMRVVFGVLLYGAFVLLNDGTMSRSAQDLAVARSYGGGAGMFLTLSFLLSLGIFLLVPAMVAGAITFEKERDSLALLFLTRLKPWQILAQKYLGALIPIFSLLVLALPLVAVTYAYGGISTSTLWGGVYGLFLGAAQVAALALLCSTFCRTTLAAFLSTYFLGALLYSIPVMIASAKNLNALRDPQDFWVWLCCVNPMVGLLRLETALPRQSFSPDPAQILRAGLPLVISTAFFLALARVFLVRRAFVSGASPLLRLFRKIDAVMQWFNRLLGNKQWGKERGLPHSAPVAWRGFKQNSLAQPRYRMRLLLAIEVPLIICGFCSLSRSVEAFDKALVIMTMIVGFMVTLVVSVSAANTFVSERVQQTLDVLLTTPLTAREIVLQKAKVLRAYIYLAAFPLLTLAVLRIVYGTEIQSVFSVEGYPHLSRFACSVLTLVIYLPLVGWLSLWIGMSIRTRFGAIITTLSALISWCAVPPFCAGLLEKYTSLNYDDQLLWPNSLWVYCASPLFIAFANETEGVQSLFETSPWLLVCLNFSFYGLLLVCIRWFCLRRADFYLRR